MKKRWFLLTLILFMLTGCSALKSVGNTIAEGARDPYLRNMDKAKAEFTAQCNAQLDKYHQGFLQFLFSKGYTWPQLIEGAQVMISAPSKGKAKLKNPTKNNMVLNYLLVSVLQKSAEEIDAFLYTKTKHSSDPYNFTYQTLDCYKKAAALSAQMADTANQITSYSFAYEQELFMRKTGYQVDFDGNALTYVSRLTRGGTPQKKVLYPFSGCVAVQNISGGTLFRVISGAIDDGIGFLRTQRKYASGEDLGSMYVVYSGLKTYTTVLGASKTVFSFTPANMTKYNRLLQKNYFYTNYEIADNFASLMKKLVEKV